MPKRKTLFDWNEIGKIVGKPPRKHRADCRKRSFTNDGPCTCKPSRKAKLTANEKQMLDMSVENVFGKKPRKTTDALKILDAKYPEAAIAAKYLEPAARLKWEDRVDWLEGEVIRLRKKLAGMERFRCPNCDYLPIGHNCLSCLGTRWLWRKAARKAGR